MSFSGAASMMAFVQQTNEKMMTATEVREKQDQAVKMTEIMNSKQMEQWQSELVKRLHQSGSLGSHVKCESDMTIIERITNDRHKLLMQNMSPKHLYLGRQQFHALRSNQEFGMAIHDRTADGQVQFMGFTLYEVTVDEHYVMTGE